MPRLTKDRSNDMAKLAEVLRGVSDDGLKLVLEFAKFLVRTTKKKGKG